MDEKARDLGQEMGVGELAAAGIGEVGDVVDAGDVVDEGVKDVAIDGGV